MAHNFWDTNTIATGLEKCGPWFDCAIGTQGKYTSLNDAIAAGHTRIAVLPGATITADLTITAASVWIIGFGARETVVLGGYKITVSGNFCRLAGFAINAASGIGIEITGYQANISRVNVHDCGGHGIYLNDAYGHHQLLHCRCQDNAGASTDGIYMTAAAAAGTFITNCLSIGNGRYGINDAGNCAIMVGNKCTGNGTSGINSSSTFVAANQA